MQITHLPIAAIDDAALPRDRFALDPDAQAILQRSILFDGLRQPIEVYPLTDATYGLISGLRRITVFRTLAAIRNNGDYTTIPAIIRSPGSIPEAVTAMVTENEVRADITPWEKATLVLETVAEQIFATPDAAIAALFPHVGAPARSRIRSVVGVIETLSEVLFHGPTYSLRQLLRIASALRAGFGELIELTLRETPEKTPAAQWTAMQNILREAELSHTEPEIPQAPGRPRRILYPRNGLTIRRERLENGYRLTFTGDEASGMMMDHVLDQIERLYRPL